MTQRLSSRFRTALATVTLGLLAASAQAGAPGPNTGDTSFRILPPLIDTPDTPKLYAAEIRNAVSVRMDALEEQEIEVDRESADGIGLDVADDRIVEAQQPPPREG